MEKKWTDGPWFAIANPIFGGAKWRICNNQSEPWANFGEICYAREANAHLIAAAPELYEACEALLYGIENCDRIENYRIEKAIDALAKARGE